MASRSLTSSLARAWAAALSNGSVGHFTRGRAGRAIWLSVGLLALVVLLDRVFPPPLDAAADRAVIVRDRNGEWLHAFATDDGRWRLPVDLADVDPAFVDAVIAVEDKRFFSHGGVDPLAIVRAGTSAVRARRIVSGASTITMQTARLLEPRPRTLPSKIVEAIRALQIERRLTKTEILELYLTLAPYGGNIEGVRAASLLYFGKEPARLTLAEQALLIALPQAPEARRPDLRPEASSAARNNMLTQLIEIGATDAATAEQYRSAPVPRGRHSFPRLAYHAASEQATMARAARHHGDVITSLDIARQSQAEALLRDYMVGTEDDATAAAIIVDNQTGEVLASVGSSGLDVQGGWMDLTRASRSPGSLLKPFIYAVAFEDGAASPQTILSDRARDFSGYRPENFDRTFRGEVRIAEALQHSLNVPAIAALDRIGAERFASLLDFAGAPVATRRRADRTKSLALGLGGGGLTLRQVATLYAGLANDGAVRPLGWGAADGIGAPDKDAFQMFSPENANRITAILQGTPSLEGRSPGRLSVNAPIVAYKTGTSYGFRDAWAAGYTDDLTIAVWVARADGAPRPGMSGREAAAPLLFKLFDALAAPASASSAIYAANDDALGSSLWRGKVNDRGEARDVPLSIVYPAAGAEIVRMGRNGDQAESRPVRLGASGGTGDYVWYVDGEPLGDAAFWTPGDVGFYEITVVDAKGRSATSTVRVSDL